MQITMRIFKIASMCIFALFVYTNTTLAESLPLDYKIKIALTFHFINLTQFKDGPRDSVTLCISGSKEVFGYFLAIDGLKGDKYTMNIVHKLPKDDLKECNALFIERNEPKYISDLLNQLRAQPILTIGDTGVFCEIGCVFNFVKAKGDKIAFEINNYQHAKEQGLEIGHQVLSRAVRVR